jgi:hypothetical protein
MTRRSRRPAVLHLRKLKGGPGTNVPSLSRAKLMRLIEEAVLDPKKNKQPGSSR